MTEKPTKKLELFCSTGRARSPTADTLLLSEQGDTAYSSSTSHLQIIYNLNIARQRSDGTKFQKNGASRGPENRKIRKIRNPENP